MDTRFLFLWEKKDGKVRGILYEGEEQCITLEGENWVLVFS